MENWLKLNEKYLDPGLQAGYEFRIAQLRRHAQDTNKHYTAVRCRWNGKQALLGVTVRFCFQITQKSIGPSPTP